MRWKINKFGGNEPLLPFDYKFRRIPPPANSESNSAWEIVLVDRRFQVAFPGFKPPVVGSLYRDPVARKAGSHKGTAHYWVLSRPIPFQEFNQESGRHETVEKDRMLNRERAAYFMFTAWLQEQGQDNFDRLKLLQMQTQKLKQDIANGSVMGVPYSEAAWRPLKAWLEAIASDTLATATVILLAGLLASTAKPTGDWYYGEFKKLIDLYNAATFRDDSSDKIHFSRIENGFRLKWLKQYDTKTWWIGGKKYWAQLQWDWEANTWTVSSATTGTIVNPTVSELTQALYQWFPDVQQRLVKTEFDGDPDIADLRLPDTCTRSVLVETSDLEVLRRFAQTLLDERPAA